MHARQAGRVFQKQSTQSYCNQPSWTCQSSCLSAALPPGAGSGAPRRMPPTPAAPASAPRSRGCQESPAHGTGRQAVRPKQVVGWPSQVRWCWAVQAQRRERRNATQSVWVGGAASATHPRSLQVLRMLADGLPHPRHAVISWLHNNVYLVTHPGSLQQYGAVWYGVEGGSG